MPGLRNNLLNIGPGSPAYGVAARRIVELAGKHAAHEDAKLLLQLGQFPVVAGDTFFLYYSVYPVLADANPDKLLNTVLEHYRKHVETEDYKRARILTELDDQLSTVYATTFIEVLAEKLAEKLKEDRRKYEELREILRKMKELRESLGQQAPQPSTAGTCPIGLPGLPTPTLGGGEGGEEGGSSGQPAPPTQPPELEELQERARELLGQSITEKDLREALWEATARAEHVTEKVAELTRMVGGREAGKAPGSLERLASLADMILRQRVDVQAIELAGRIADSMPRFVKVLKERDRVGEELGGYRLTRNPERALPRELALPDEVFYYKLANSGLLAKEKVAVKEGALYVLLDKSGSMAERGKFTWANATALALLKLARAKGRRFYARLFDHGVYQLLDDRDPLRLSEELLTIVPNGGTSIDSALRTALRDLAENRVLREKVNTVIMITDGEDTVTVEPGEFRRVNATLVAVMIKGHNEKLEELARATGGRYMKVEPTREGTLRVVDAVRR